jgi:hypothetical protein
VLLGDAALLAAARLGDGEWVAPLLGEAVAEGDGVREGLAVGLRLGVEDGLAAVARVMKELPADTGPKPTAFLADTLTV